MACEFVSRLAARGHTVHVAAQAMDLHGPLSERIVIHRCQCRLPFETLHPLELMARIRSLFTRLCRKWRFDIVHQLNPVEDGLSALVADRRVPLVLGPFVPSWLSTETPSDVAGFPRRLLRRVIRFLLTRCDVMQERKAAKLILSTPAALEALHEPRASRHKISVLPYGIDTRRFSPRREKSCQEQEPKILFLANLVDRKGIYTLLEAFEQVGKAVPICRMDIAGGGPELERVRRRVTAMRYGSRIRILGEVERSQVAEFMRGCSLYCLPSYGEPFGVSALEAMACGKPVVATNAGGLRYLVGSRGGRKVPIRDAGELARSLVEILQSPELQDSMGRYNRALAIAKYDWELVIDRLEQIYAEAIAAA
jgi:glycosyltransferase involved in cell wall biosynthesis